MKRFELFFMVFQVPIDFFMLLIAAISAYYLRFTDWALELRSVLFNFTLSEYLARILWVIPLWLLIFAFAGLYIPNPNRRFAKDIPRIILACATGLAVVAVYVMFTQQLFDSRFLVAASAGFAVLYIIFGRLLMRSLKGIFYRLGKGLRRVVIIGADAVAEELKQELSKRKELGYAIADIFPTFDDKTQAALQENLPDEILFANPRAHEKEAIQALEFAGEHHIDFKYSADLFATLSANMAVHPLAGIPIVELRRTRLDGWGRVVKRLFDVIGSIILIVLVSPIMLLVAFTILLETGRPIIYRNERVGLRGNKFFTLKFRSMYQKDSTGPQFGEEGKKAEERERELIQKNGTKPGPIYKIANDPRVTPFGRFIRRWSLDELPQFFNVLAGDMSIVGPRPHQPREVAGYERRHKTVFSIKPGVTGLAQISGRSDLSFEEEMRLDVLYIERWSVWLDLIIFLKTPFVIFKKRKAL